MINGPAIKPSPDIHDRQYDRKTHLTRLIPLWPHEIDDHSPANGEKIITKLRKALRSERNRGRAGHWTYDLNRHLALLDAYRAELAGS